VVSSRSWQLDLAVEIWRQPRITGAATTESAERLRLGGAAIGRFERPIGRLSRGSAPVSLVVEAGAKTGGFVAGEPLRSGALLRAGLGVPLDP
jgi:hypothetical protein